MTKKTRNKAVSAKGNIVPQSKTMQQPAESKKISTKDSVKASVRDSANDSAKTAAIAEDVKAKNIAPVAAASAQLEKETRKKPAPSPLAKSAPINQSSPPNQTAAKTHATEPDLASKAQSLKKAQSLETEKQSSKAKPSETQSSKIQSSTNSNSQPSNERKETMTKTEKKSANNSLYNMDTMIAQVQDYYNGLQERTELAYEETMKFVGQCNAFHKDNFAAVMESGKIASKGVQEMGQNYVETSRKNMKAATDHAQQLATTHSVVDFLGQQSDFVRQGFDKYMEQIAQNSESWLKLAGDVAQPLSNRTAVVADTVKKSI